MTDLVTIAFQADLTRVVTFLVTREGSNRSYREIGIPEGYHALTHHQYNAEKISKVVQIQTYHAKHLAYYLDKLKATPDGDGSLLDHSMLLYGSGMGNPDVHDHVNLPVLVAGGGAGRVKGARHIKYAEPTPLANLHLTLLDKVGVNLDAFADSRAKVGELLNPATL